MGLSSEINKHDKEVLKNAPLGTRSNSLVYSEQELKREHVIITDMMASPNGVFTWSKPNTDPKDDMPMTGLDYWQQFQRFMLTRMGMKPRYMVVCVDDRRYVPVEKERTQLNRQKYSKVEEPIKLDEVVEYKGNLFSDEGFLFPGGRSTPEPIPPSLCRGSSHLRKPLARYLLYKLETWLRESLSTCTSFWGTSLIFDHDGFQFVLLEFDALLGVKVSLHDYIKGFPVYGEADGKVVAWANFFMDTYNIQIETTDTDIKGWATELVRVHKQKKYTTSIHWITKDVKTKELIVTELRLSTEYLRKSMGFETNRHLLVWMIAMKTDYWPKNEFTNGFGKMDIAKAIKRPECSNLIPKISFESAKISCLDTRHKTDIWHQEMGIVTMMLVALLGGLTYSAGTARLKNKPDANKLQELAKHMWWHIGYWEMNMGISLDIIKKCNERHAKSKAKSKQSKSNDMEMKQESKKLIVGLIPPLDGLL